MRAAVNQAIADKIIDCRANYAPVNAEIYG